MADDNNTPPQSQAPAGTGADKEVFTKDDVQALLSKQQADFDTKLTDTTKKLQDEAAKSRISKDDVFKTFAEKLGMEYNPDKKPDKDVFAEKLAEIQAKQKELEDKALKAEEAKTKLEKQTVIKEKASKLGFADPADVLAFISTDAENVDEELKKLAETKAYLLGKKPDIGGGTPPPTGNDPKGGLFGTTTNVKKWNRFNK